VLSPVKFQFNHQRGEEERWW